MINKKHDGFRIINPEHLPTVVYSNEGKEIEFDITGIINKRLKDIFQPTYIFKYLNEYLEYKGSEFKARLYDALVESKIIIHQTVDNPTLPYSAIHKVLDLFDYNDVRKFIDRYSVNLSLPEEFDDSIIKDDKGTREQTYLVSDYKDLLTLLTIIKSVTGPIGEFAKTRSNIYNNIYKEYILFSFLYTHKIFKTPPFQKLYESIIKLVDRLKANDELTSIRTIERQVSIDILPVYLLALATIQKLLVSSEVLDNDERNVITKIYNFITHRLKLKESANTNGVKLKTFSNDSGNSYDSESILESYRLPSNIAPGFAEEFRFAFRGLDGFNLLFNYLKFSDEDIEFFYDIRNNLEKLKVKLPIEESIWMTSWLYKDLIDSRGFEYLKLDEVINAIAGAIVYLSKHGFNDIALLISTYNDPNIEVHNISSTSKVKLTQEIKEKLDKYYPYKKEIKNRNEYKMVNYIDDVISNFIKAYNDKHLISVLSYNNLKKLGYESSEVILPVESRLRFAEYILFINEGIAGQEPGS